MIGLPTMIVAWTLYLEAGGEGREGIDLVASVIANRAQAGNRSVLDVCLEPRQFSAWNDKPVPAGWVMDRIAPNDSAWSYCLLVAKALCSGAFRPCTDATHYHARHVAPAWASGMTKVNSHRGHVFYREART